jgi:hypothetical protein
MHVFVKVGDRLGRGCARTAQLDDSLAAYSKRRCASPYERARPASRGQPLQRLWRLSDHSSEARERSSEPCIVFLCITEGAFRS